MKKIISASLAAIMVLSICIVCAFANAKPVFSVDTAVGDRGDTVTVTLNVENVTTSALTVQVAFDTNVLEATGGTILQQVGMMKQINAAANANSRGLYDYTMFAMSDEAFQDGGLATLSFKVKDDAVYGDTALNVSVSAMQTGGVDVAENCETVNGKVTVACLNHNTEGVDWTVTEPAKCEETGLKVKYCTKCEAVAEEEVIPVLGHRYVNKYDADCANGCGTERDESYKPVFTLTSDGGFRGETVEVTLNVQNVLANALTVNVSFDTDVLEATGSEIIQSLGVMKQVNAPENANERGIYSYNVFDLSDMAFEDGALVKFTFKVKDAAALGKTILSVSDIVFNYGDGIQVPYENCKTATGEICVHDITDVEWIVKTDATCEEDGLKEKYCSVCGDLVVTEVIDALGHDYNDFTVTLDPTWKSEGSKYRVCQREGCENVDTVVIPAATVESVVVTNGPATTNYLVNATGTTEFDPTGMVLTVYYSDWDVPTVVDDFTDADLPSVNTSTINHELEYTFNFAGMDVTVVLDVEGKVGDIDNNGTVNIIDVQKLFVAVGNGLVGDIPVAIGDFDGNGTVNIIDVQKLFVAVGNGLVS